MLARTRSFPNNSLARLFSNERSSSKKKQMCIFLRSSTSLTGISQYCFCVFQFTSYTFAGFAMNVVCTLLVATSFPRESESWERYESSATTRKFVPSAMCLLHTVVEYDRIIAIETSAIHSKKKKNCRDSLRKRRLQIVFDSERWFFTKIFGRVFSRANRGVEPGNSFGSLSCPLVREFF